MSLFEQTETPTLPDNATEALVGEGKKYKTVEDLARSRLEADLHIATLEREARERRDTEAARVKLTDLMDQISQKVNQPPSNELDTNPGANGVDKVPTGLTPEQLDKFLEDKLNQRDVNRRQDDNIATVKKKLQETVGNSFPDRLRQEAQKLGVSEKFLESVAAENPAAFFRLVGLDAVKTTDTLFTPPKSSVNSSFTPTTVGRTKKFYDEMKKSNPNLYKQSVIQRHNDAIAMGEAWFDA